MDTPVLFLIFNRPGQTERVFSEIRRARPKQLFIAADGPRDAISHPDDRQQCDETRRIATSVDWPCEVRTLFRESNLGCRRAVSSGIDWFFGLVEEGIILEDDCLPDPSFFPFCEELLARYRDTPQVTMISGFNGAGTWTDNLQTKASSYIFSQYVSIWGWATWRRAWKAYDVDMRSWHDPANKARIRAIVGDGVWKAKQWTYDRVAAGTKDTWDYQWEYASLLQGGLCAVPRHNLIENIGIGAAATHTAGKASESVPQRQALSFPLAHLGEPEADAAYDAYWTRRFRGSAQSLIARLSAKIRQWLQ